MSFIDPQEKKSRKVKCGEREAREWVPLFLSNDQETPCPERHKHDGKSEVVHRLTGKLCP